MRTTIFKKEKIKIGEKRVIKKFLFWPTTINGETRFLETANIQQISVYNTCDTAFGFGYKPMPTELTDEYKWKNLKWLD